MYNSQKQKLQQDLAIDVQLHQHIILVSSLLKQLIKKQQQEAEVNSNQPYSSMFDNKSIPQISLQDYLRRIHKLTKFSSQSLIIGLIIMDRYNIESEDENFHLTWLNAHRLLLSCLILAIKIHDDFYYDNKAFETAGGVNVVMLEKYELQIFQKCKFNLYVNQQEYDQFLKGLYNAYGNEEDDTDQQSQNI